MQEIVGDSNRIQDHSVKNNVLKQIRYFDVNTYFDVNVTL